MKRSPMTAQGAERLRAEVERLKSVERPRIIAAIAEARAHGDLKENAEYHAAREQQGFIEGRIKELEAALSYAEVIDVSRLNPNGKIVFGAIVELEDEDNGEMVTYQIVGDLEADIKQRLISVSSPFARALIGKSEGDSFEFQAPNGTRRYEIVAVRYSA
ncbi:MAG TPA: transcription elongation factor GreA [Rudaea sp.]|nr:transcription elongation factor GreA [Rudaea sp.]